MRVRFLLLVLVTGMLLFSCCWLLSSCEGELLGPELTFSPTKLPTAVKGEPYQVTITILDNDTPVGNVFIKEGDLPQGLTLDFSEGNDFAEIGGTPEERGTFKFVISAWCLGTNVTGDKGEQAYTLIVE